MGLVKTRRLAAMRRQQRAKAAIDAVGSQAAAPLKSEEPVKMNARLAAKYVDDAAKALDVELSRPQKRLAESLLVKYGTDMSEVNAQMFAKFVVRLPLTDDSAKKDRDMADDTAKSIRKWRSFEFGDSRLVPFENAAKDLANSIIHEYMDPGEADKFMDSVHDALIADANRGIFVFNGTRP